eukprot:3511013-Prymnesium_polylepis.1
MLWSARERVRRARKRKLKIVRTWLSQGWTTSNVWTRAIRDADSIVVHTPQSTHATREEIARGLSSQSHAFHTIAFWRAAEHGEHWSTILARTKAVRPQLCRLYRDSLEHGAWELRRPDGSGSGGVCEAADKPALCHALGRRSFAHDFFSPFCPRRESAGDLHNDTRDPMTHYNALYFEERCALALVPLWETLGEPEPTDWTITRRDKVRARRATYTVPPARSITHAHDRHASPDRNHWRRPHAQTWTKAYHARVDRMSETERAKHDEEWSRDNSGQHYG